MPLLLKIVMMVNEKGVLEIAKNYDICGINVLGSDTIIPVRTVAYSGRSNGPATAMIMRLQEFLQINFLCVKNVVSSVLKLLNISCAALSKTRKNFIKH